MEQKNSEQFAWVAQTCYDRIRSYLVATKRSKKFIYFSINRRAALHGKIGDSPQQPSLTHGKLGLHGIVR